MGIQQTPTEVLDYVVNWPNRGLPTGATISTSTFTASDPSITLSNKTIITNNTQTQFFLTGGVAGQSYTIKNEITLSTGQTMDYTIQYQCIAQRLQ